MAGSINLNLVSAFNDKGIKDAVSSLKKIGSSIGEVSKKLLGGVGAWQAYDKSVAFVRGSIDASRDLQRNLAGLTTIFGAATPEMVAFSEAGVQLGMSTAEAAKATTFIGSVMKQSGFAMSDNIPLTKELVKLGSDLAATYGYDVQEALTGMTALFRGEYDPIEKFGVAIKQAQVNAAMAEQGFSKLTGTQKLHAQQLIRMQLLFKATSDSQGAFGRMGDTLAVSQMRLAATFTNMKAALGNALLQPMTQLIQLMTSLTTTIGPSLTGLFAAIAAAIGMVSGNANNLAQQFVKIIDQITGLFQIAAPVFGFLISLMSNFGAAILIGVTAFKLVYGAIKNVGIAVTALNTIMALFAARQAAATAATEALTVAEGAATVATKELAVASAATPWGAIALVVGLVVAGIVGLAVASGMAKPSTDAAADSVAVLGNNMAGAAEQTQTLHDKISGLGSNMADLNTMTVNNAVGNMTATAGVIAYTGSLREQASAIAAARKEDEFYVKGAKEVAAANFLKASSAIPTTLTPEQQIAKQIAAFKKSMNAINNISASGAASKAAKSIADPFKTAVDKIKGELAGLHDSLMGAFDITSMGKSGSTISRNMSKLLAKMREFSALIKNLRAKGLNADLLTQLVKAGPVAGLDAAKALSGSDALMQQANQSYGEYGALATSVASEAIQAKYQNQYNIKVDGGVGSGATIGKAVVSAIQAYERQSGANWRTK